ncbi:MAG: integrase, partial [Verrucomicrobia bacterium]|nr:integrase [Verrucomicrobiota bacterium]
MVLPEQAETDETLIALWLDGRSAATRRARAADSRAFLAHAGRPLRAVTMGRAQAVRCQPRCPVPREPGAKTLLVKSLLGYGHRLGYLPFDVGAPVRLPAIKGRLAERIMAEAEVHRLLALEPDLRNR